MTQKYDVIVVGGGIVGCAIAYHLTRDTTRSVCLLEKGQLTSGTTWHAAGLVAELRASPNLTRLARYSGKLYEELQNHGEPTGFKRVGALTLAKSADRQFELQKQAAMARALDVDCTWQSASAIRERWPHVLTEDLVGGVFMPNDGQTNPVDTTLALARLARRRGAEIREQAPVTRIRTEQGRVRGVLCNDEEIIAEQVVLCAGLWSRRLGSTAGANFPLQAAEHFYAVTEAVPQSADQPIVRVPDDGIYVKPDAGRLLIGCFERQAKPIVLQQLPERDFIELPFDLDHFMPYLEAGLARIDNVQNVGIRTWFNGPESFTPDGRYLLGESPDVEQLFVAAGFNSIGIQSAGGVGQVMTHWLAARRPPYDLWEVDVRRFQPLQNTDEYLLARTAESLGLLYAMHWPFYEHESARGQLTSPIHSLITDAGACFGELAGWERANWYGAPGSRPAYEYTYRRPKWFDHARTECSAVRADVALFDQTSFAKYAVTGADACAFLNHLSTANLDVPIGRVVYCQWLNSSAGIEADVTITRIDAETFWIISAAASRVRDLHWMHRHLHPFAVTVTDITMDYAVIGIMGPNARIRLEGVTDTSLESDDFAFATSQLISIAGVELRAMRVTYVGALGWELYIPWEDATKVYAALTKSPIVHAGYHAMDSLRLEKGYRHWGHDITEEDTPLEAGLGFTVDWDKSDGFMGRDALLLQKQRGVNKRFALFRLQEPNVLLTHDEPIWQDNRIIGQIRSAAYSFTYDCTLATGYIASDSPLTRKALEAGQYQIEIADRKVDAIASLRGWYDPQNLEIHR